MTLKVIGAGYGRTGTMSLKLALEQLGFGPCYHMVEVFKNPQAPLWWIEVADGHPDWEKIFAGYSSTVDWPNATYYKELAEAYPEAKVILTERDPEAWFRSTQATIFARDMPDDSTDPWMQMVLKVVGDLFDRRMHDKDKLISVFKAHNARVREVIPPERLLVYEVADGWAPLCEFLGAPVPDGPMPKVNSTEEFQGRLAKEIADRGQPAGEPA
ncbi:sulfotransferase family protein [Phenylobacterium sp.]|uniref:sulfotransferase family protein n=1 Tax=Phenylobacterium sp. TaxID=1871053 RepID=UPI002DEFBF55|nr:sulfotransferase [Phenylobacterium sp.]